MLAATAALEIRAVAFQTAFMLRLARSAAYRDSRVAILLVRLSTTNSKSFLIRSSYYTDYRLVFKIVLTQTLLSQFESLLLKKQLVSYALLVALFCFGGSLRVLSAIAVLLWRLQLRLLKILVLWLCR